MKQISDETHIFRLLFAGNGYHLPYKRAHRLATTSVLEAILLEVLIEAGHELGNPFTITNEQIRARTLMSEHELRTAKKKLIQNGLIYTKRAGTSPPTCEYGIYLDVYEERLLEAIHSMERPEELYFEPTYKEHIIARDDDEE